MEHKLPYRQKDKVFHLIIHHNDMDGWLSAAIAARAAQQQTNAKYIQTVFWNCGYAGDTFNFRTLKTYDMVTILDYSLPVDTMDKLMARVHSPYITWIDHHITAIQKYTGHPAMELSGIRADGLAGCELAWLYYFEGCRMSGAMPSLDSSLQLSKQVLFSNCRKTSYTVEELTRSAYDNLFPEAIRRAGRHDVWRFNTYEQYLENLAFNDGFYANFGAPCNMDDLTKYYELIDNSEKSSEVLKEGTIIVNYNMKRYTGLINSLAFPCKLRKFPQFKCIAINTDAKSAFIFESVRNDYEIGIVFRYTNTGKMEYSIYRLGANPEHPIRVNKIAETFGGGGHVGAAGFTTNGTLVVEPLETSI